MNSEEFAMSSPVRVSVLPVPGLHMESGVRLRQVERLLLPKLPQNVYNKSIYVVLTPCPITSLIKCLRYSE